LQTPLVPHVEAAVTAHRLCGSAAPAGTGAQLPAEPATLQAWQVPHVELPQQTPSTQKLPVRQSSFTAHAWPSGFLLPHRFVARSQMLGEAQPASETQVVLQAVPLHANGAHGSVLAGRHTPAPSQVRASVCVEPPAGHDGGAQIVPAA
jgi:hypothetical protein